MCKWRSPLHIMKKILKPMFKLWCPFLNVRQKKSVYMPTVEVEVG